MSYVKVVQKQVRSDDGRPRMSTNSEALLHAGVDLAKKTWYQTKQNLGWENSDVNKVFTHQVRSCPSQVTSEST